MIQCCLKVLLIPSAGRFLFFAAEKKPDLIQNFTSNNKRPRRFHNLCKRPRAKILKNVEEIRIFLTPEIEKSCFEISAIL